MKTKQNNKLVCIGSVAYDSIKTPFGKIDRALGGSATYFSLAASFFTQPAVVAVVGNDFKKSDENILANKKIGLSGLKKQPGKTFAWGGEYSFDLNSRTTLFTHLNVFEHFQPQLNEHHKLSEFVFLGNIHPKLQLEVLSQIKKPRFVGLDTMNFWIESAAADLKKVLKQVDILIINDSEARELSKEHNLIKAAKKILLMMAASPLNAPRSTLIIKRGEYGLLMFQRDQIFNLPGYPLEDVVDPTGAGDTFAGGFFGYLAKTGNISWSNLKTACLYGSTMASFCVEKLGTKKLTEIGKAEIKKRLNLFNKLTR